MAKEEVNYQKVYDLYQLCSETKDLREFYGKHSNKCTFYSLRFGCSFAVANTIKPQLL